MALKTFFSQMDRIKLLKHVSVFKKVNLNRRFNYSQKEICDFSGIDSGVISRLLNGRNDVLSDKFFNLLYSMPEDFQREYWKTLGVASLFYQEDEINWEAADEKTLGRIFSALGKKYLAS